MGEEKSISVKYNGKFAYNTLGKGLSKYIDNDPVIVCIGTDKCIGDSLGPMVGTLLLRDNLPFRVYGTLRNPIHALNINKKLAYIRIRHPFSYIIAIDACIGDKNEIGNIYLRNSPVFPGKGVGKEIKSVGDISIVGMVDSEESDIKYSLYQLRLGFVMDMAETIVKGLRKALLYNIKDNNLSIKDNKTINLSL